MTPEIDKTDTIARCWQCVGEAEPSERDAQRAALCREHERARIRLLMGLDGMHTPLEECRMVI